MNLYLATDTPTFLTLTLDPPLLSAIRRTQDALSALTTPDLTPRFVQFDSPVQALAVPDLDQGAQPVLKVGAASWLAAPERGPHLEVLRPWVQVGPDTLRAGVTLPDGRDLVSAPCALEDLDRALDYLDDCAQEARIAQGEADAHAQASGLEAGVFVLSGPGLSPRVLRDHDLD